MSDGRSEGSRLFYQVLNDCINISRQYTNVSSGSRAEGLDMDRGDFDMMTILNEIVVDKKGSGMELEKPMLYFDASNSYPGFVQIKIPKGPFEKTLVSNWGVHTENGPLVSNFRFKEYFMKKYRYRDIHLHGPCIASIREDNGTDHLFCLRSRSRLDIINEWVMRVKSKGLVNPAIISKVANQPTFFVPIGSKFDAKQDCPLEWRLSFSFLEKQLVYSWNHTQLLSYAFLKWVKSNLVKRMKYGASFSSYFIKTTLYWLSEENPQTFWRPCNIIECILAVFSRLSNWLRQGFCPHYFIPDNNLFGSMDKVVLTELANVLSSFHGDIFSYIISGIITVNLDTLEKYVNGYACSQEKLIAILYNLQSFHIMLQAYTLQQVRAIIKKSIYKYFYGIHSYYERGLYLTMFCIANQVYCDKLPNETLSNKRVYTYHKDIISHLLIGKNSDAIAGWSKLAMFFGHMKLFRNSCKLINFIVKKVSITLNPMNLFTDNERLLQYFYDNPGIKWDKSKSFVRFMRTSCISMLYLDQESSWFLQELLTGTKFNFHQVHPIIFGYFLAFFIFHTQGNIPLAEKAICNIIKENREKKIPGYYAGKISTYIVLEVCYHILKDMKAADYWAKHVERYTSKLLSISNQYIQQFQ